MLALEKEIKKEKDINRSIKNIGKSLDLLQRKMQNLSGSTLIIIEGWESSGKGYLITRLRREIDPRHYYVKLFEKENEIEKTQTLEKRFWQELPKKGSIAIFDKSYYSDFFEERIRGDKEEWLKIWNANENILMNGHTHIIKIFLDISKEKQRENIQNLQKDKYREFLISENDIHQNENYQSYRERIKSILKETNTKCVPWHIVSMEDRDSGTKKAMTIIEKEMEKHIENLRNIEDKCEPVANILPINIEEKTPSLKDFNPNLKISKEEYKNKLRDLQRKVQELAYEIYIKNKSMILVFEGTDAAGKGGAIKRLTRFIDPRSYRIHATSALTEEEHQYHYMHRFIKNLPSQGQIKIFDRSWYGRILVEKVEGFATKEEINRAYNEINVLEKSWSKEGISIVKFYLTIDKDKQLERFKSRENNPEKNYKLTDEDWRNRNKWKEYTEATELMFQKTSTVEAPWHLICGNDKRYARIKVLEIVIAAMEDLLLD